MDNIARVCCEDERARHGSVCMEQLLIPAVLFIAGILLIVKGGDFFVDAAVAIARASGVPPFIIGATIVSLATTLPEIIVSTISASEGKVDMAIANAIGSVSANTGLVLALSMILAPFVMKRRQFVFKGVLYIVLLASLLMLSLSGQLTLMSSLVLLFIFALFVFENIREARAAPEPSEDLSLSGSDWLKYAGLFVAGAIGIVLGSRLLVDNGSELALLLGIPEKVVALTAIAIGTCLPELVTAVSAIRKGHGSLSVGNVLGANIIDMALILPLCAAVRGGALPVSAQNLMIDLPACLIVAAVVIIPSLVTQKFSRWQGVLALGGYLTYLVYSCL